MTKNAITILDIIMNSDKHLTAEEIFFEVKRLNPNAVMSTIYNNLKSLTESGKIVKLATDGGADRYDKPIRHDHLVCSKCGKFTDIHIEDLTEKISNELGIEISSYDLRINYICEKCKKKIK